jgi:hypothetical protein
MAKLTLTQLRRLIENEVRQIAKKKQLRESPKNRLSDMTTKSLKDELASYQAGREPIPDELDMDAPWRQADEEDDEEEYYDLKDGHLDEPYNLEIDDQPWPKRPGHLPLKRKR